MTMPYTFLYIYNKEEEYIVQAAVKPPIGAIESSSAYFWLDEDGVVTILNKPKDIHGLEDATENIRMTQEIAAGTPRALLIDVTKIRSMTRDARETYKAEGSTDRILAVALVTTSVTGRIMANFFLGFNKPKAPTRLFNDYHTAHNWLLQQMKSK